MQKDRAALSNGFDPLCFSNDSASLGLKCPYLTRGKRLLRSLSAAIAIALSHTSSTRLFEATSEPDAFPLDPTEDFDQSSLDSASLLGAALPFIAVEIVSSIVSTARLMGSESRCAYRAVVDG
jgi:hypothetical protein